ncbi:hypothetical protein [Haloplanus halobius]|uniref:hypothetical protein n=1 Tax=Haloplanus halobius TaxID=2934938 RepID=UPI00200EB69B|nr:hypothetical protein [Haloplanus sp. XH21]
MRTRALLIGLAIVVVVGAGAAFGLGLVGGADSGTEIESFPTATEPTATADGGTNDEASSDTTGTATGPSGPAFEFTVDRIDRCGETCRDVTTTLSNDGESATGVTVYTRIYAGNGTDGDVVWEGTEAVGSLDAGASHTATKRVELSVTEAYAVRQAGGWITVRTAIESDQKTVVFTERRNVG